MDVAETVDDDGGPSPAGSPSDESWRAGGWPDVLHAFAAAPDAASSELRSAANAIMESVARALEDSDDDRALPSSCLGLFTVVLPGGFLKTFLVVVMLYLTGVC